MDRADVYFHPVAYLLGSPIPYIDDRAYVDAICANAIAFAWLRQTSNTKQRTAASNGITSGKVPSTER